jgi:hypothetical protein
LVAMGAEAYMKSTLPRVYPIAIAINDVPYEVSVGADETRWDGGVWCLYSDT